MNQLIFFKYQSYFILMFIGAHNDDFNNMSLHQLGPDRNPSFLIEWVTQVISSDDERSHNSFVMNLWVLFA